MMQAGFRPTSLMSANWIGPAWPSKRSRKRAILGAATTTSGLVAARTVGEERRRLLDELVLARVEQRFVAKR